MSFGIVFIAIGAFLWMAQIIYKITECALSNGALPNWEQYQKFTLTTEMKRNVRAVKIGISFFILFGIFGWIVTASKPSSNLNDETSAYVGVRLLLPFLLYLNINMRFLIFRLSGNKEKLSFLTTLKFTGIAPSGASLPASIVRATNIVFILALILFLYLAR